jgi:glycosyltransferase involved in cell wall biosynthesis
MHQRTEHEIIENWKEDISKPIISICCIAYNHEEYIAEALDSILMQETNFAFEIIVRDDASTDNTADIIRKYEAKYSKIIKPIYEKENGYQKGIKPVPATCEKAVGEYIALCEGDDYWTDKKKLQKQLDKMRLFPDCNISFHPAEEVINNKKTGVIFSKNANKDQLFLTPDVILGEGHFCPTASLIFKRDIITNLPKSLYKTKGATDYIIQIMGSINGGALYINETMSIYRREHPGSWSVINLKTNDSSKYNQNKVNTYLASNESIILMNNCLNMIYNDEFMEKISKNFLLLSFYYLECKMYEKFNLSIMESYAKHPKKPFLYKTLYYMRSFPSILRLLYLLRIKIKNFKKNRIS